MPHPVLVSGRCLSEYASVDETGGICDQSVTDFFD